MLIHLAHILVFALAVFFTARIVPGIKVKSFGGAIAFAFVLAVLDKLLFGILLFLSFPMLLLSFGLFVFVINGVLWLLANKIVSGVQTDGLGSAILGSIVTSALNWLFVAVLARF